MKIRYAVIATMTAVASFSLLRSFDNHTQRPASDTSSSPPTSEESPTMPAKPATVVGRVTDLAMAVQALDEARQRQNQLDSEVVTGIPIPDTPSPLQVLAAQSRSIAVRSEAQKLHRRLKLEIEFAVRDCWRHRPDPSVWPFFSADLVLQDEATIGVERGQLARIKGNYALDPEERSCIANRLSSLGPFTDVAKTVARLRRHLPLTETVQFEWPCSACRKS